MLNTEQKTSLFENIGRGSNSLDTEKEKKQEEKMWIEATAELDKQITQDILEMLKHADGMDIDIPAKNGT